MNKYTIGIIGSGSLASIIGMAIGSHLSDDYEVIGIFSAKFENAEKLANKLSCKAYKSLEGMIIDKPDYIIEAASPDVVRDVAISILENNINLIPLSIGALADDVFYKEVEQMARDNKCKVYLVSGGVGGFDILSSAVLMEDVDVKITTEKAPRSLNGAPFLRGRELSNEYTEDVFTGTAREAIKVFPRNINVGVATALATTGVDNTDVTIRSIPGLNSNKHNIELKGNTVKINISIESIPSVENPKSSPISAWSVVSLLKRLVSPISF